MLAYIKRRSDFATVSCLEVSSWALPLETASEDSGSVVLATGDARGSEGDFFLMDGHIWLIDTVTVKDGKTTLKLVEPEQLFQRSLVYTAPGTTTIGAWVRSVILSQYRNLSDTAYALPYLSVTNEDSTAWQAPETDDNGIFQLTEYLQTIRRLYHIRLNFSVAGDALGICITKEMPTTRRILFTDGSVELTREAYSSKAVAKITTLQNGIQTHWYLSESGSISNRAPSDRAVGEWKLLVLKENDDALTKVTEQFAKNKYSHKLEFMSSRRFELYDPLLLRMGERMLQSYISYVGYFSDDSRYHYKSGELKTTMTETMKGVLKHERDHTGRYLR